MGGFCAKSENDDLFLEHSKSLNHDLLAHHYSEKPEKKHQESLYSSVHLISEGNHRVEKCERLKKIVVVKRVEKNIFQGTEQIEMQKQILLNVRFPFICKLIQYRDTPQECVFELECCVRDLRTYKPLTDEQLKFIVAQIALAINQIHKGGYIYRALHPSHVLIAEDGYIRLIGFGHSSNKSSCPQIMTYEELCIFPPETIYGVFDQAGDWWSLGSLMYKIITDQYPFENPEKNFDQLREEKEQKQIIFPQLINPSLSNFISELLQSDTKQRLQTLEKVKEHEYFNNFDWEKLKNKQIVSPLII